MTESRRRSEGRLRSVGAAARQPNTVVTKAQLMDAVWPGLAVVENNLNAQVKALRQALGDKTILTVPGRGYRLGPLSLDGEATPERANRQGFDRDPAV